MIATLWWVRHGPTHAKGMVGWTDLPADLSDTPALDRLAAHLPPDAAVVSSDLARAVTTADAICGPRRRLPHDPGLREIHFGTWEMRRHDEIEAEAPEHIRAFWDAPGDVRPPDGESWNALSARVSAAADRLAVPGGDLIVVAHFGAILSQVQRALGIPAREAFAQPIDTLSVTRLTFDGTWRLEEVNHRP
ncbi:Broad specificity phosphatase PhoE [Tranquillimonas alkanivorans]|uniref:Broad specificity phosphatase PhoE n=1 Tax=Tranquillimonas alkanivorans TaxID=441119 RepID=A0A1I5TZZ3_9RHOB|nr:histidine phosphatase family protein [Tranquillimonas alkanivorans]SFP88187.1 Broad specificity phosphatase PhoE [Tranquillimonas alkanivorans]